MHLAMPPRQNLALGFTNGNVAVVERIGAAIALWRLDALRVVVQGAGLEEHAAGVREVDEPLEERGSDDDAAEDHEACVRAVDLLEDGPEREHSARVAAGTHHARNNTQRRARDVGHNAEVQALGHLNARREHDHDEEDEPDEVVVADAVVVEDVGDDDALAQVVARGALLDGERCVWHAAGMWVEQERAGSRDVDGAAADDKVVFVTGKQRVLLAIVLEEADHLSKARVGRLVLDGGKAHDDAEGALGHLRDPHRPKAAAHAEAFVHRVGDDAAPRAREEVHQAEACGERARLLR
eukprot:6212017-Pleurochrysis_carterae.AAC.2